MTPRTRKILSACFDAAVILMLVVVLQFLEYHGAFAVAEGKIADYYLRNAARTSAEHRVVTIAITNDDYAKSFGSTSPLNQEAVTSLIAAVLDLKPTVIGVDLLTDSWKPFTDSNVDSRVRQSPVPIVWASSGTGDAETTDFPHWLQGHHDEMVITPSPVLGEPVTTESTVFWGVPIFPLDHDRGVRRFPREWLWAEKHQKQTNTFAREIAAKHCRVAGVQCTELGDAEEVFISYESSSVVSPPAADFSIADLFECASEKPICTEWRVKGGVSLPKNVGVLLGGTFDQSRDFYPTPIHARTPGLIINARAVEAEFKGPKVLEATHLFSILFDVLIGCLIIRIFGLSHEPFERLLTRLPMRLSGQTASWLFLILRVVACALLAIPAVLTSRMLFEFGILWISWVGMILTTLGWHVIVDLLKHSRPEAPKSEHAVQAT